jgi:hypothetical protein
MQKKKYGFFWSVGYVLSPVYVEFVKFVSQKTDLPVKVALRDAGPVWDVAQRMAARSPAEWSHLKDWEPVWLGRYIVHRLDNDWRHRIHRYYRRERKQFYEYQRKLFLDGYVPLHGLDRPFAFVDTGIQGRMSRVLNEYGIKNTPLFMVSDEKCGIASLWDDIRPRLAEFATPYVKFANPRTMIDVLDSIPQRTLQAYCIRSDMSVLTRPARRRDMDLRARFDAGLFYGVDEYLDMPPRKKPMMDMAKCLVAEWTLILLIFGQFMDKNALNYDVPDSWSWGVDDARRWRDVLLERHRMIYNFGKGGQVF